MASTASTSPHRPKMQHQAIAWTERDEEVDQQASLEPPFIFYKTRHNQTEETPMDYSVVVLSFPRAFSV